MLFIPPQYLLRDANRQIQLVRSFFKELFYPSSNRRCVALWCRPLSLEPEQSDGHGSIPGRAQPLERHEKGSHTRLALSYFCDLSAGC